MEREEALRERKEGSQKYDWMSMCRTIAVAAFLGVLVKMAGPFVLDRCIKDLGRFYNNRTSQLQNWRSSRAPDYVKISLK